MTTDKERIYSCELASIYLYPCALGEWTKRDVERSILGDMVQCVPLAEVTLFSGRYLVEWAAAFFDLYAIAVNIESPTYTI